MSRRGLSYYQKLNSLTAQILEQEHMDGPTCTICGARVYDPDNDLKHERVIKILNHFRGLTCEKYREKHYLAYVKAYQKAQKVLQDVEHVQVSLH